MELLADPWTLTLAVIAVIVVGMAKGGFSGLGVLATPLLALSLPAPVAAAVLMPVLLAQDAVSVWSFRKTWDKWIVAWMLPGTLFGAASGFTSQIAHAGGPPFQMWVTPRRLPHETFVGTSSVFFALINWIKVPSYLALGSLNAQTLAAGAALLPLAIISTLIAVRLIRRLDSARFYTIIYLLMVALGAKLVWDGLVV